MREEKIVGIVIFVVMLLFMCWAFGIAEGGDWRDAANKKKFESQDLAWSTYLADKEYNTKENEILRIKVENDNKRLNLK